MTAAAGGTASRGATGPRHTCLSDCPAGAGPSSPLRLPGPFGREADPAAAEACRQLWCAVIVNAAYDAAGAPRDGDAGVGHRRAYYSRQARQWFARGAEDFRAVCALAGLDADFVRDAWRAGRLGVEALRRGEPTGRAAHRVRP